MRNVTSRMPFGYKTSIVDRLLIYISGLRAMALSCFGKSLVSFYRSIFPSKDQSATVIVGSGIIGTSTAFWLKENCPQKRVIIVEARPDAFSRASHYNSGILSYHWLPKELQAFGKYTYDVYLRLFKSNRAFREYTGFRDHSVFEIRPGHGPSMANIPPWANIPEGYHVGLEPSDGQAGVM
jgi:glycine/D-amino acid oxidase-like deaminating enzyme